MSKEATDRIWFPMQGVDLMDPGGGVGWGGFGFGFQPRRGGDAARARAIDTAPAKQPQVMRWGAQKGSGDRQEGFVRFDLSDLSGVGTGAPDKNLAPNAGSIIDKATLVMRSSGGIASEQIPSFPTVMATYNPDAMVRFRDPINTTPEHARGFQCSDFEVRDEVGGVIDGTGTANTPFIDPKFSFGFQETYGFNRAGNSFAIPAGGASVKECDFNLNRALNFVPADNVTASIYRCQANDGTADGPDPAFGPIGPASGPEAGLDLLPTQASNNYTLRTFTWATEVALTEGRYCILLEGNGWDGVGEAIGIGTLGSAVDGIPSTASGRLVGISSATARANPTTQNLGFALGGGNDLTEYDYPYLLDNLGALLNGSAREVAPIASPELWETGAANRRAFTFAITPTGNPIGTIMLMDIQALMTLHFSRVDYASEIEDFHPLILTLATSGNDPDEERETDLILLQMSWRSSVNDVCAEAEQDVVARAVASQQAALRAVAQQDTLRRAAVSRARTVPRAKAAQTVGPRGVATMTVCPKE